MSAALEAIPALIVAIPQGGLTFLWVLLFFVIIQNLDKLCPYPLLVGSSVGVHPLYAGLTQTIAKTLIVR